MGGRWPLAGVRPAAGRFSRGWAFLLFPPVGVPRRRGAAAPPAGLGADRSVAASRRPEARRARVRAGPEVRLLFLRLPAVAFSSSAQQ